MKRLVWCVCALVLLAANQAAANLFVDPSFENQITYDGPPFLGTWEGFNGGAGSEIGIFYDFANAQESSFYNPFIPRFNLTWKY